MKSTHSSGKSAGASRGKPKFAAQSKSYPKPKTYRKEEASHDEKDSFSGKPKFAAQSKSYPKPKTYRKEEASHDEKDSFRGKEKHSGKTISQRQDSYRTRKSSAGEGAPKRKYPEKPSKESSTKNQKPDSGLTRLNKYLANAGICSRREADELIKAGAVSVNGITVTELGTKVSPADKVQFGDQTLKREKPQYVLLNKPKGYITTLDDPQDRKTVFSLIQDACKERIYPVGRLDRNTTGLLLFTNDGDLTKKLTHPSFGVTKLYHVELDKSLTKNDFDKILAGVELEDGFVKFDKMAYTSEGSGKKELGVEIHSGRNRVVRRVFESLDYTVVKLDRVLFSGLTKKNLPRGKWRFLTQEEINHLKMFKG